MHLRQRVGLTVLSLALAANAVDARATGVPIDGFLPMVGIGLTDEFVADIDFFPYPSTSPSGTQLGAGGTPYYDVALLDTGAAASLITTAADAGFNIAGPYPGESDGFRGTEFITIGGATGFLQARISDPLGLYANGLQTRTGAGASLTMNTGALTGQTNTSIATLPVESDLPNILGLPFASQYATRIRNSLPQVFELDGKTVRAPAIDFLELGTGSQHGISRKAPLSLLGDGPSNPFYFLNFGGGLDDIWENPSQPTVVQGGHFLNINAANNGAAISGSQFFFDTGASVTVLSELTALQLGIDVGLDEPEFTIQIVGSGGVSEAVPGYFIDQFTVLATGGSMTVSNVPVLVFDVTNPASPGNVVPGIVGTNVFAGRDIIIDPVPSLGGGGASAGVYISDPVTTNRNWASAVASSAWNSGGNWSGGTPSYTGIANLRHVSGGNQEAVLSTAGQAFEANISGVAASQKMTLRITSTGKLTAYSGINIEAFGAVQLEGGRLDAQYVEVGENALLSGNGTIDTGSGPIPGQVENIRGTVALGASGALEIVGRYSNGDDATLEFLLGGTTPGVDFGELSIEGPAALGGTLKVRLDAGYDPAIGDRFTLLGATEGIGGRFDLYDLPATHAWLVEYQDDAVVIESVGWKNSLADFDNSGQTNQTDLAVWEAGFTEPAGYNGGDFLLWQRNYGGSAIAAVPEPGSALLATVAAAMGVALCRRTRRSAASSR
ncbi:MAG: retropepsin-like domain-containing protein [Planctomycetales bacterium]|nr:retropepsin-like domain-containing protein [Planctomycetales bacterium]